MYHDVPDVGCHLPLRIGFRSYRGSYVQTIAPGLHRALSFGSWAESPTQRREGENLRHEEPWFHMDGSWKLREVYRDTSAHWQASRTVAAFVNLVLQILVAGA